MRSKLLFLILLATLTTSSMLLATDLRGRVDGPAGPLVGTSVALFQPGPNNTFTLLHSATTGPGGLYYFNAIEPGDYVLQVDGKNYPVHVEAKPQQDIAPIHAGATPAPAATATPAATPAH